MSLGMLICCPPALAGGPTGGRITSGSGTISQNGGSTLIDQQSQNLAINWTSFSIGSGDSVRFAQPDSGAIALNRVVGQDPSTILGSLQANGQVFILNPNGVLFGKSAQVDVGALAASTLNLSDADFQAGHYQFTAGGTTPGTVLNLGRLTAAPGGYLTLIGPKVTNQGSMSVVGGTVLLAAGNKVSLHLDNGSLLSYSIDRGALNALAENDSLIRAAGGRVYLSAMAADSVAKAVVNNRGVIEAQTVDDHGGVIRLLGDPSNGQVNVGGTLDASAPNGGDGGTIETSAAQVKVANDARITTAAAAGKTGSWVVDPTDFTIAPSGGDISGATLDTELASSNVTLSSSKGAKSGTGAMNVDDTVSWSSNSTLTLNASGNIYVNNNITATGNTAGLVLNYGSGGNYYVNGAKVTLSGSSPTLSIGGQSYTVINSLGVQGDTSKTTLQGMNGNLSGNYALGSDLDASATSGWTSIQGLIGLMPIGSLSTPFTGQFAGLGHVISNLTVNYQNNSEIGLFGETGSASVIRDVGLNGGTVVGTDYVGSLVGINGGTVLDSYSNLSMNDQHYLGGLVGENNGTISGSYDTGTVISKNKIVGGLVGLNNGTISDSYATGTITAPNKMIGGLVGENGGTITDSYAAGKVGGTSQQIGGLVGYGVGTTGVTGTVTNSFWDTTTSGQASSAGGTGMTTAAMKTEANFTSATSANGNVNPNWDFNGVWTINNGSSYPLLKGFLQDITVTADNVSWTYTSSPWNGSDGYSCSNGNCSGLSGTIAFGGTAVGAINVGTYSIIPSGLTSTQYAITFVPGQLTISPALLAITGLTANSKVYDGTQTAALSGSAAIKPFGSDSSNVALSGAGTGLFASKNVGTNEAVAVSGYTLTGSAAGNYTLVEPTLTASITPYQLAISGLTAQSRVYDATTAATLSGAAKVSPFSGDDVALGGSGTGTFASKNVGTQAVTVSGFTLTGNDAGNYTLLEPSLTASITPYQLAISGLTAQNKVYDATTTATLNGTAAVKGLTGDSVALAGSGTGTFASKDAGTGKAVTVSGFSLTGADSSNYTLVEPAGLTATITPAPLAVRGLTANSKVYDGTTAATFTGTPTVAAFAGDDVSVGGTGTATFLSKNAGAEPVSVTGFTLTGTDASDYTLIQPTPLAGNITPAPLAITGLSAQTKVYDATTTATLSGAATIKPITGDDVALGGTGAGTFASKNVGTQAVSVSGFSLTGTDAGNYTLVEPTGLTAGITPYQLAITGLSANNKTYDGTTTATLSGTAKVTALTGDSVALQGAGSGTFASKNVGTQAVTVSGLSLTGADSGNYTLLEPTLTASITPYQLAVSGITAENKVYDATTAATLSGAATVSPFSGDKVAVGGTGTGTFASKDVGTQAVTVSGFTLTGADAGNYTIAQPAGLTASITPKPVTVTGLTAVGKVYDATTAAALSGTAAVATFSGDNVALSGTGTGTFASKNVGTQAVTVTGFSLSGTDSGNYTLLEPTGLSASITPYSLAVTGLSAEGKVYDATTDATLSGSATISRLGQDDVALSGSATGAFGDKNVGTNKAVTVSGLTLSGTDAGNYTLVAPANLTASITPAPLAVGGVVVNDKVYDGTTTATLTGFAAVFGLGNDIVNLNGTGTATFASKNVGSQAVTVSGFTITGADAGNYTLSQPTGLTANITPAPLAITGLTAASKIYDATTTATLSGTGKVNGFTGDSVALGGTGTATFASKNVGTEAVTVGGFTLTGADAGNYTLVEPTGLTASITPAQLLVTGLSASGKVYDATATAALSGAAAISALGTDNVLLNGNATGAFADKNVGSNKAVTVSGLTLIGTDAGNYTLVEPTGLTASITPADLNLSGISASNKVYDATVTASLSGTPTVTRLGNDAVSVSGTGVGTFGDKNVGSNKAVTVSGYSLTGADAGNYVLVEPAGLTANISPAPVTITGLTAQDRVYDATTTATLSGTAAVKALGNDKIALGGTGTAAFASKNAGTGEAVSVSGYTLGGTDAGNYTLVEPTGLTANITPAPLAISGITAKDKVYDATTAATLNGTATIAPLTGDDVSVSGTGFGTFGDKNVGSNKAVAVSGFTLTGSDAGNYTLVEPTGLTASITPADLILGGLSASNKVYDSTVTASLSGTPTVARLGNDAVSVSGNGVGTFGDKNAGSNKAVTVSGYSLTGADAGNYVLVEPTTLTANITQAPLAITGLTTSNKVYDGTATATLGGGAAISAISGDNVALAGTGSGAFADKNAGANKAVTVSGYSLTGTDAGNYALIEPTDLTASITPRPLTVSATGTSRTYDGLTDATVALSDNRVSGDALTTSFASAAFADPNAGTGKTITVSGITLGGVDARNYTFNTTAAASADITPAALTVTATNASRTYSGTTFPGGNGVTYSGFVNNETASVLSGTLTYGGTSQRGVNVGTYSIIPGGVSSGNYAITFVNGTLQVTPAPLTVTANDDTVAFSGTPFSGGNGVTYSGFVANQGAGNLGGAVTYGGTSQGAVNTGSYTIIPGGLTSTNYAITFDPGTLTISPAAAAAMASAVSQSDTGAYIATSDSSSDGLVTTAANAAP